MAAILIAVEEIKLFFNELIFGDEKGGDGLLDDLAHFGIDLVLAILIFILGKWLAGKVKRIGVNMMKRAKVDETLQAFAGHIIYFACIAITIIAALAQAGVEVTVFVAIIGAAGLAIGLAFQGALSNFASGVLIIIFRPLQVGDIIETSGHTGRVEEIEIFTTRLVTLEEKTVIIPNSVITSDCIVNYSKTEIIRVEFSIGASYDDSTTKVRKTLFKLLDENENILKDPKPNVSICEYADFSINYKAFAYVKVEDYWTVFFEVNNCIKDEFDAAGINIPFPRRDVHVYEEK